MSGFMRLLFLTLLMLAFPESLRAQFTSPSNLYFDHLSLEKGLSQSTVLSIWQDSFGFIWLGTRDGLNRYDGYDFESYKKDQEAEFSETLAGNIIHDIAEDHTGNLWLATDNGLSVLDRKTGNFKSFSVTDKPGSDREIDAVSCTSDGNIWVGSKYGLLRFDPQRKTFIAAKVRMEDKSLATSSVHSIYEDSNGIIWVGASAGVYKYDIAGGHVTRPVDQDGKLLTISHRVEAITKDLSGNIYLGSYGGGLYILDKNATLSRQVGMTGDLSISNDNIRSLTVDKKGNIWIGTFQGLNVFDPKGHRMVQIDYQEGARNGLSHNSIRSLFTDNKGAVWIGTYFGGVNIFDEDNQRFEYYHHIPGDFSSLTFNVVSAFTEYKGTTIIGTERGGLNSFAEGERGHRALNFESDQWMQRSGNTVKSLYTDSKGRTWAGLFRGGLVQLMEDGKRLSHYPRESKGSYLDELIVNDITEDDKGFLWIASDRHGGLHKFDPESEEYIPYSGQDDISNYLNGKPLKSIHLDHTGRHWLSTHGAGLILFDQRQGSVSQLIDISVSGKKYHIPEINHVLEYREGSYIISTNGMGMLFYGENSKVKRFHSANGLLNDIVFGSLVDHRQNVWVVTLNGISRLEMTADGPGSITHYTHSSGFPIQEINEGAFFQSQSGEFLIGGSNGYTRFDPVTLVNNDFIPPVIFTDLKLSNQSLKPDDEFKVIDRPVYMTKEITLTYFQSVVTFDFTALSFVRPENNQYAYYLEGFDEAWNYIDNKRSVTFTNLPDDTYTLHIKGSNNDGVWNENATMLTIHVLPPPWKTWWAFTIYSVLIVLGFFVIRYNALRSAQLKHDLKLEQIEKDKWQELHRLKLEYFTDVSHEIRTPLTLISGPVEEIVQSRKGGKWLKEKFRMIHFNSKRLLLLTEQILEIRELETGHSRLKLSAVSVDNVLRQIVDAFKELADKKNIRLTYSPSDASELCLLDTDKIEKIFFNLIYNAFKFTPSGGQISVIAQRLPGGNQQVKYRFKISDTGKGMEKEQLSRIFERFYHNNVPGAGAGIGLSLTKALTTLMNGSIEVESVVNKGTIFTIEIPFDLPGNNPDQQHYEFSTPVPLSYQPLEEEYELPDPLQDKPKVLIAEDQEEVSTYLYDELKQQFQVKVCNDGNLALKYIEQEDPDIIISDIMIPGMNGLELCKTVKNREDINHIPVILLTARTAFNDKMQGLEFGADDYITKPFVLSELKLRVSNLLKIRKRLREKFKSGSVLPDMSDFSSYDEKFVKKVVALVDVNAGEPTLTVEFLSAELGLSRVQLFRKLKKLVGMSPNEFIKNFRLKKAAAMLKSGRFKVSEVAYSVGFQDVQYFSKCFKKAFKKSPTEYVMTVEDELK